MDIYGTYFRGNLVHIVEFDGKHAWVRFHNSDNSRRVLISDLMTGN